MESRRCLNWLVATTRGVVMGWEWGRLVKTGLLFGGLPLLGACLYWHRWWYRVCMGKSSTFIGWTPKS
jgi:hypothetical protein